MIAYAYIFCCRAIHHFSLATLNGKRERNIKCMKVEKQKHKNLVTAKSKLAVNKERGGVSIQVMLLLRVYIIIPSSKIIFWFRFTIAYFSENLSSEIYLKDSSAQRLVQESFLVIITQGPGHQNVICANISGPVPLDKNLNYRNKTIVLFEIIPKANAL